ncbi:hypothetical protein KEJ27_03800 [Candidatus Bathyarchaeota archaeon]|nr:hypothetical protein [Candidatus Bathyarchaeota archaeon]MBS7612703.1 hypothetical protein [Candidatus Bathyarchaeota archaeon]MBS7618211.1 hypothetical protein [Candidatus Bathyarchaeota archaeon]
MSVKQQRFKISPTGRGAIFKLKRWFYLTFYTKNMPDDVKERSRSVWLELSRRLIEEMNRRRASEKPTRITLEYEADPNNEFKPISVAVEVMEMKPIESFKVSLREEAIEAEEREKFKAQLVEMLRKARELGITPENLIEKNQ